MIPIAGKQVFFVSVLLSAYVQRVSVSLVPDFNFIIINFVWQDSYFEPAMTFHSGIIKVDLFARSKL